MSFISTSRFLSSSDFAVVCPFLFLGGGEDYRQNPAESHQFTEGESVFLWPHGNINVLDTAVMAFPLVSPERLPLLFPCSLNSGCAVLHNVIRCSQQRPQGLFNPEPLLTFCWYVVMSSYKYPCLPVCHLPMSRSHNQLQRRVWDSFLITISKSSSFCWLNAHTMLSVDYSMWKGTGRCCEHHLLWVVHGRCPADRQDLFSEVRTLSWHGSPELLF